MDKMKTYKGRVRTLRYKRGLGREDGRGEGTEKKLIKVNDV